MTQQQTTIEKIEEEIDKNKKSEEKAFRDLMNNEEVIDTLSFFIGQRDGLYKALDIIKNMQEEI